MKNSCLKIKNNLKISIAGLMLMLLACQACSDDNAGVIPFATTDEMLITAYLEANPAKYSEFLTLMRACSIGKGNRKGTIDKLLNAYGNYTCFIPTNEAVFAYYRDKGISSANDLSEEELEGLVYNHLISCGNSQAFETFEFPQGQIPTPTFAGRYLNINYSQDGKNHIFVGVDEFSLITDPDLVLQNGVIHAIDKVLEISRDKLPDLLAEDPRFSLFNEALVATGLVDSLLITENEEYERLKKEGIIPDRIPTLISYYNSALRKTPEHCFYGFTILAESNETLAREANITDFNSLNAYAKRVYDGLYPEDAGVTDVKDPRNSLNRYVRYHIIDRLLPANEFIPSFWTDFFAKGAVLTDYTETLSHCLIEIKKTDKGIIFNQKANGTAVALVANDGAKMSALNGELHEIDRILTYEGVESEVLYKRLRMDVSSLLPEMATNKLRGWYASKGGETQMIIPQGYFKNLTYSEASQLHIYGTRADFNFLGDEFLFVGKYDLTLRLPPVPRGTYEIRVGYSANSRRAVSQMYLDGDPCGIPLDMKISPSYLNDAYLGWIVDGADEAVNRENDKAMHNRGYMKAPNSVLIPSTGAVLREKSALRKIITIASFSKQEAHLLRIKSVEDSSQKEMMIDYIELVPIQLIDTEGID